MPGYSKFLRNSGMRLIANDFPIESKVGCRLMNDSLSARHRLQTSHTMRLGDQTLPATVSLSRRLRQTQADADHADRSIAALPSADRAADWKGYGGCDQAGVRRGKDQRVATDSGCRL